MPPAAPTEALTSDSRAVFTVPLATAEARSTTSTVIRSSTCAARTSLERSANREAGEKSEPGAAPGAAVARATAS